MVRLRYRPSLSVTPPSEEYPRVVPSLGLAETYAVRKHSTHVLDMHSSDSYALRDACTSS
jgi:hypothetical protein